MFLKGTVGARLDLRTFPQNWQLLAKFVFLDRIQFAPIMATGILGRTKNQIILIVFGLKHQAQSMSDVKVVDICSGLSRDLVVYSPTGTLENSATVQR